MSGKTVTIIIIGRAPTVKVLARIVLRNYDVKPNVTEPLKVVATSKNNDYILRIKDEQEDVSDSFPKMFESYLEEHGLLIDPRIEQKHVFYNLRHTYVTLALVERKSGYASGDQG